MHCLSRNLIWDVVRFYPRLIFTLIATTQKWKAMIMGDSSYIHYFLEESFSHSGVRKLNVKQALDTIRMKYGINSRLIIYWNAGDQRTQSWHIYLFDIKNRKKIDLEIDIPLKLRYQNWSYILLNEQQILIYGGQVMSGFGNISPDFSYIFDMKSMATSKEASMNRKYVALMAKQKFYERAYVFGKLDMSEGAQHSVEYFCQFQRRWTWVEVPDKIYFGNVNFCTEYKSQILMSARGQGQLLKFTPKTWEWTIENIPNLGWTKVIIPGNDKFYVVHSRSATLKVDMNCKSLLKYNSPVFESGGAEVVIIGNYAYWASTGASYPKLYQFNLDTEKMKKVRSSTRWEEIYHLS